MNIFALFCCVLVLFNSSVFADYKQECEYNLGHGLIYGQDYFECDEKTEKRVRERWYIEYVNEEPEVTKAICAFDVSESGRIAVATTDQYILIYDNQRKFEYALKFKDSGDYGVLWAGENIALLTARSDGAYVMSDTGALICAFSMSSENINYWNEIVKVKERNVGNIHYYVEDRINTTTGEDSFVLKSGYKFLISVNDNGQKVYLYEATENLTARERFEYRLNIKLIGCGMVVLMIWIIGYITIRKIREKYNYN